MPIDHIIVDFDHTLYDTAPLKRELSLALEAHGVSQDLFWQTYRECYLRGNQGDYNYNLDDHLEKMRGSLTCSPEEAKEKVLRVLNASGQYLDIDARPFLDRLVALNIPSTLFARGDKGFEAIKVRATGIEPYFLRVISNPKRRVEAAVELLQGFEDAKKVFWISHKFEEMEEVKKLYPYITPILKRRAEISLERYRGAGMLNFTTLKEIMEYLTIYHATSYGKE